MSTPNTKKFETLAILFADISGSTALYETLGDVAARDLVSGCLALLTRSLPRNQGKLIKTIGDEIMCTFPSAGADFRRPAACRKRWKRTGPVARSRCSFASASTIAR